MPFANGGLFCAEEGVAFIRLQKMNVMSNKGRPFSNSGHWIWSSEGCSLRRTDGSPSAYEVRRFRKSFPVPSDLDELIIHITADSRYVLFLNGIRLGTGPTPGDVRHQYFDTYRIPSPQLIPGRQTLSALVLDYSKVQCDPPRLGAPAAIMTRTGGLAVDVRWARDGSEEICHSDSSWKVAVDRVRRFHPGKRDWFGGFVGHFEHFVAEAETAADWQTTDYDDSGWENAVEMYPAVRIEQMADADSPYGLIPRVTPLLQPGKPLLPKAVFLPGGANPRQEWQAFFFEENPLQMAPDSTETILVEFDREWTGVPLLEWEQGAGAEVRIGYAEALRLPFSCEDAVIFGRGQSTEGVSIGFNDATTGWTFDPRGTFEGFEDIVCTGPSVELWQPLHWRTAKFVQLTIRTGKAPLRLKRFAFAPQHYPLEAAEPFRCSDRDLEEIQEINLHTLRLSMHETFVDCPYYEQLQYIGDSAMNCQVAMMAAGAYPAAEQLLRHFDWSRVPEGWTQSRYPSRIEGIIPSQSLDWIGAAHAYGLQSGDLATLDDIWQGLSTVLNAYRRCCGMSGLPENLPYWNWIDWCPGWKRGVPPGADSGPVLSHCAKFGIALRQGMEIAEWLGDGTSRDNLGKTYSTLRTAARQAFWNGTFFAENRIDPAYGSRLGNAYAILAGFCGESERTDLANVLAGDRLADCSYFGYFFVRQALWEAGHCDWRRELTPWLQMKHLGLTTWAEDTTFWRSLCHGWSSNPAIDVYTRILGVRPLAPGFSRTLVEPAVGMLDSASGGVFTPRGLLKVSWNKTEEKIRLDIPEGIFTTLILDGATPLDLASGVHTLPLTAPSGAALAA